MPSTTISPYFNLEALKKITLISLSILAIPLILTALNIFQWGFGDFIVMGAMLISFGSVFVFIASNVPTKYKWLVATICLLAFLWIWLELAVGVFTTWGS